MEIYLEAKKRGLSLSLSTVYRTIDLFRKLGYLKEVNFQENHLHFEIKEEEEHLHLVCQGCGKIEEMESKSLRKLKEEIEKKSGINITGSQIIFFGLCRKCQKNNYSKEKTTFLPQKEKSKKGESFTPL
jgi:Fur family ferric uptake transcriptional regulator